MSDLGRGSLLLVVGGGFSGLLTAVHLLRTDPHVRVRLVERRPRLGEGRAFSTGNPAHVLNVRASNMSAFPDRPDHFTEWLGVEASKDAFVDRGRYAEYLRALLRDELHSIGAEGRFLEEQGEVIGGGVRHGRWSVALSDGRAFDGDALVLAVGYLSAGWPSVVDFPGTDSGAFIVDPWSADLSKTPNGDILLVGSGLTMVDVAMSLSSPRRKIIALSRRGLVPFRHAVTPAAPPPSDRLTNPASALGVMRRHAKAFGWRSAVDSIRPFTAQLWSGWSDVEKRRFIRHLQPWWDVHRHRMAPATARRIDELRSTGALEVLAGHLLSAGAVNGGVEVTVRPRGQRDAWTRRFAAIVNCTAPRGDPSVPSDGLIADLYRQGLLREDSLRLGIRIDDQLRVIGAGNSPSDGLFAVGPLTRGAFWEAVAVPDLRNQTARAARAVLQSVSFQKLDISAVGR